MPANPAIVYRGREAFVHTQRLSGEARQQLWAALQTEQPELAAMLANDEFLTTIRTQFSAAVVVPLGEYRALMKKEKTNHGEHGAHGGKSNG